MKPTTIILTLAAAAICWLNTGPKGLGDEYLPGIEWAEPAVIDPGQPGGPPSDAVVLFDGTDLSQWNGGEKWAVKDGYFVPDRGRYAARGNSATANSTWNGRPRKKPPAAARDAATAASF
jgi:hypothetical protein